MLRTASSSHKFICLVPTTAALRLRRARLNAPCAAKRYRPKRLTSRGLRFRSDWQNLETRCSLNRYDAAGAFLAQFYVGPAHIIAKCLLRGSPLQRLSFRSGAKRSEITGALRARWTRVLFVAGPVDQDAFRSARSTRRGTMSTPPITFVTRSKNEILYTRKLADRSLNHLEPLIAQSTFTCNSLVA